jgi:integrase
MTSIKKRKYRDKVADGSMVTRTTAKYYGFVNGRYVPLATDRQASESMLREMKSRVEKSAAGFIDAKVLTMPVTRHIDEYRDHLEAMKKSPEYVRVIHQRLMTLSNECDWRTIKDVTGGSVTNWIARYGKQLRASKESKYKDKGKAPTTINHFVDAARSFCVWAVRKNRLYREAMPSFEKVVVDELRRERRALTLEEFERFLGVAGKRRLIYWSAMFTGLRRSELGQLQWGDVRLENVPRPFLQLRTKATKSRRPDHLPLRDDLADALRAYRPERWSATDCVFPRVPTIATLKRDLADAGIEFETSAGRADLHAIRHSFCTHLAAAGVDVRLAMFLMRHTDQRLTAKHYTDEALLPLRSAIEKLPSFAPKEPNEQEARATGTNGRPANFLRGSADIQGGKLALIGTDNRTGDSAVSNAADGDWHEMAPIDARLNTLREVGLEPTRSPTGS